MPAEAHKLFPLKALPGIKRDTTDTEGQYWSLGQWVRFYRGLPRSILGYRSMTENYPGPSRGLLVNPIGNGYINVFSGSSAALSVGQFNSAGVGSNPTDITPSGFSSSLLNVWQMDSLYNGNGGGQVSLCAHAGQNLADIASTTQEPVYYGNIQVAVPLTASTVTGSSTVFTVDGGIVSLPPFLVAYGSNGLFAWSAQNDPSSFPVANAANVCPTKIVKGLSIRGGSNNPSALLWSLDSLIQASFVGGATIWNFNTLSDQISILSSSAVVEMDGIYYWPGIDRFLVFNGTLHELPNEMNLDYFYTNLNMTQRQKVFGFKIPRWGEIWWCFPTGSNTECNHAVIFNVRENVWYDTELPSDGRSAAYFAQTFPYPIMSGASGFADTDDPSPKIQLWQHEYGHDCLIESTVNAIESFVLSPSLAMVGGGTSIFGSPAAAPDDCWTELAYFEPDFKFNQTLNFTVFGREYPQDQDTVLNQTQITQMTTDNTFDLQVQARYLRWKIDANEAGGYFNMGQPLFAFRSGDHSR